MKFLIKTTEDLKYTKEVAKQVTKMYKDFNLDVGFDVKSVTVDVKGKDKYTTETMWASWLKFETFRYLKWDLVVFLYEEGYDGICLFIDDDKVKQSNIVRGIHTVKDNKGLIQIYSQPKTYIKKIFKDGKTFFDNSKKKTGLNRDVYVLHHEVAHHLEYLVGLSSLHHEETLDRQKEYLITCIDLLKKKSPDKLFPRLECDISIFIKIAKEAGIPIRVTEGFRSFDRQNELYAQGRTKPGSIVTNAKGGESFHNYGVAFDIVPLAGYNIKSSQWAILGEIGTDLGYEWGGSTEWIKAGFVDKPHFQLTFGYTLKDFQNGRVDYSKYN